MMQNSEMHTKLVDHLPPWIRAMIIISARRTWITLRKLRSIQATPAEANVGLRRLQAI